MYSMPWIVAGSRSTLNSLFAVQNEKTFLMKKSRDSQIYKLNSCVLPSTDRIPFKIASFIKDEKDYSGGPQTNFPMCSTVPIIISPACAQTKIKKSNSIPNTANNNNGMSPKKSPTHHESNEPGHLIESISKYQSNCKSVVHDRRPSLYNDNLLFTSFNAEQPELIKKARDQVEKAIKERKIFTILGPYPCLRKYLRKRDWVEKFSNVSYNEIKNLQKEGKDNDNLNEEADVESKKHKLKPWKESNGYYLIMSYLARKSIPSLIFSMKSSDVLLSPLSNFQIVNHFGKSKVFTTKTGLLESLQSAEWFDDASANSFYPRCFKLDNDEEKEAFIEEFRLTACEGFLKYFLLKYETQDFDVESEKTDKNIIPKWMFAFSLQHLEKFIKFMEHDDIDTMSERGNNPSNTKWDQFLKTYNLLLNNRKKFGEMPPSKFDECQNVLNKLKYLRPQYDSDGFRNIWVIKPGAKSRGRGIQCSRELDTILNSVEDSAVSQKYIENTLLIHNTKFDIRQWFLVTDWNPLCVWFYKDCYLRFCSQEFTLEDLHESIHLSNNSIQKHYSVQNARSNQLPDDNMWESSQFEKYLREEGFGEAWSEEIIPAMKKALISSLHCSQECIEPRKNSFELYGADFMISRDMKPWLLEINSSPSMAQNTKATNKLVECVLEDTLKVVLDRKEDKKCDIGRFESLIHQSYISEPKPLEGRLFINGRRIRSNNSKNLSSIKH